MTSLELRLQAAVVFLGLSVLVLLVLHHLERSQRRRLQSRLEVAQAKLSSQYTVEQASLVTAYLAGMLAAGADERGLASIVADVGDVEGVDTDASGAGSSDYDTSNHSAM